MFLFDFIYSSFTIKHHDSLSAINQIPSRMRYRYRCWKPFLPLEQQLKYFNTQTHTGVAITIAASFLFDTNLPTLRAI
jgi:hypothetical protein